MVVMRGCRGGTPPPKFSEGSPPHDRRQCRETFPDAVTALRRARWGRPRVTGGGDCESQPIGGQCQLFSGARRRRNLEPVGGCGVVKRIMTVAAGRCCVFVHALRTVAPRPKEPPGCEVCSRPQVGFWQLHSCVLGVLIELIGRGPAYVAGVHMLLEAGGLV